MIVTLVGLILIIGLLMYLLAQNPKIQEVGRIMFFCALFAFLFSADKAIAFFQR